MSDSDQVDISEECPVVLWRTPQSRLLLKAQARHGGSGDGRVEGWRCMLEVE